MIATRSPYARCCALVVLMLMFALVAFAQSRAATGNIVGRVLDPKGAAIPHVTVTATNQATGFEKSATTDSEGNYRIIRLPPGSYDVKTSASSGFAQSEIKDLAVNVGGKTSLDINLSVGGEPNSREAALAKSLADDLEKAGVEITEKDMDDIVQGIREGGETAKAIARFILAAIVESESHQKSQKTCVYKKAKSSVEL